VVEVPRLTPEELSRAAEGESTAIVRARVLAARERMVRRQGRLNSELLGRGLRQQTPLSPGSEALLQAATKRLALTARSYDRMYWVMK
jgi:magnesium chelatase family protein